MKAIDLNELKNRINSLAIFRDLLCDDVIASLLRYLDCPCASLYAEFVSFLYKSDSGNLTKHIAHICECSDNIYVRTVASEKEMPVCLRKALESELETLQMLSSLKRDDIVSLIEDKDYLPDFVSYGFSLAESYIHKTDNIGKYGYGIYANNHMFYIDDNAEVIPVNNPDATQLCDLIGYEHEKKRVVDNTFALINGKPAANVLLTGDAGTGKSSTVKAVCNEFYDSGLRLIEVRKEQLKFIPKVLDMLSENPLKFILFIDDLSFSKDDDSFSALKAVLEGSVSAKSRNVVIYATSNRRHIVKERFSERDGDEIHRNDTMQEQISLSERFGIHISFHKPNKEAFLRIVRILAEDRGLLIDKQELESGAERFALERGGRSPRLAMQYIDYLESNS